MPTSHLVVNLVISLEAHGSSLCASWCYGALVVLAAVSASEIAALINSRTTFSGGDAPQKGQIPP